MRRTTFSALTVGLSLVLAAQAIGDELINPKYDVPVIPIPSAGRVVKSSADCRISVGQPFALREIEIGETIGHNTRLYMPPNCSILVRFSDGKQFDVKGDHKTIDVIFELRGE